MNDRINALVAPNPRALEEARAADAAVRAGASLGVLHGVPFSVKDILDVAGLVGAAGVEERREHVAERDATVVARMRAAGAIVLGKTNTPPYGGGGVTDNPVHGRTNHPLDAERSPGGSSGGEAALIGAGGAPMGIGSDSGGSLRVPAHYCGVATLKPTNGRVPSTGFFPHTGPMSDPRTTVGPLARRASDLGLLLRVIAGPDGIDSGSVPVPLGDPGSVDPRRLRVAFYTTDGVAEPTEETARSVESAARALERAGATVEEARPDVVADAYRITFGYWQREQQTGAEVAKNLRDWDRMRRSMLAFLDAWDLIVCPASHRPAPMHGDSHLHDFGFTLPFSLTGWPVAVVRAGTSPEGLPIGVQLVAGPWRDDVAIACAERVEQGLDP